MRQPDDIDITQESESAALVIAANHVLVALAVIGIGVEAGNLLLGTGSESGHAWEKYVTRTVVPILMLIYLVLFVRMDYSRHYWQWHAITSGVFAALVLGGIGVALVQVFELSWTFVIVTAIFLVLFSPIVVGIVGLLGAALHLLEAEFAPYRLRLTKLLNEVEAFSGTAGGGRARVRPRVPIVGPVVTGIALVGIATVPVLFGLAAFFSRHDAGLEDAIAGYGGIALMVLPAWGLLLALGRRLSQPDALRVLKTDARPPVLLLRSFTDDPQQVRAKNVLARYLFLGLKKDMRLEAAVKDELQRLGPFVAVGEPGERLPQLGAARAYFEHHEWQSYVLGWMARARLIVMVAGRTEGVTWELGQLVGGGHMDKVLILFPPGDAQDRASRWQLVRSLLGELPGIAALQDTPMETVLGLHFHPSGAATVIRSQTAKQVDYELAIRIALYGMFQRESADPFGL